MSKRHQLAEVLYPVTRILPVRPSFGAEDRVMVLAYHGVDDTTIEEYPLDDACISATSAQFESQLQFLARHFTVLTFATLHNDYVSKGRLPKRGVILTFDDGYRNNYTTVFPLLQKYGVPATIFLATGYVGTNKRFWFEELSQSIMRSPHRRVELSWNARVIELDLSSYESRRQTYTTVGRLAKRLPNEERLAFLDAIGERLAAPPLGTDGRHVLDWDEVSEMAAAGVEFGSHTVTHPILSRVSDEQAAEEIAGSKAEIERRTGCECVVFSYPNGKRDDFGERERGLVRESGYRYAVSYVHGVEPWTRADRYALRRLHVERDTTRAMFRVGCGWWPRVM